mmetsp:Transcript_52841/g.169211  ORF Transcript_52841/g.169211 Transcript_52841/m.169211 type:complete len:393 (-) Transcript_52841:1421-2599(-)
MSVLAESSESSGSFAFLSCPGCGEGGGGGGGGGGNTTTPLVASSGGGGGGGGGATESAASGGGGGGGDGGADCAAATWHPEPAQVPASCSCPRPPCKRTLLGWASRWPLFGSRFSCCRSCSSCFSSPSFSACSASGHASFASVPSSPSCCSSVSAGSSSRASPPFLCSSFSSHSSPSFLSSAFCPFWHFISSSAFSSLGVSPSLACKVSFSSLFAPSAASSAFPAASGGNGPSLYGGVLSLFSSTVGGGCIMPMPSANTNGGVPSRSVCLSAAGNPDVVVGACLNDSAAGATALKVSPWNTPLVRSTALPPTAALKAARTSLQSLSGKDARVISIEWSKAVCACTQPPRSPLLDVGKAAAVSQKSSHSRAPSLPGAAATHQPAFALSPSLRK